MKRKPLAICLCLLLCLCMLPVGMVAVSAASTSVDYLALGDSISTGYGLADRNNGFTSQIAKEGGYSLTIGAVDGYTSVNLKAQVTGHSLDAQIANAEVITITCGGNDLMGAVFQALADRYNSSNGTNVSANEAMNGLMSGNLMYMLAAMAVLSDPVSAPAFQAALAQYEANMYGPGGVLEYIRSKNSSAMIVLLTQYNPYKSFSGSLYSILNTGTDKIMAVLNDMIKAKAPQFDCCVSDVYTVFANDARNLCNATPDPLNIDVHPNQEGHDLIRSTVQQTIRESCSAHVYVNEKCALCGKAALTVSFSANGGSGSMAKVAISAGEYTLPQNGFVAPSGYQFKAWSVGGAEYAPGASITVSDNTTVQALWKPAALAGTIEISGTSRYGNTLTATLRNGNNTGTLSYQWYRRAEGDSRIDGATGNTYTLTAADIGCKIYCVVTSSVQTGSIQSGESNTIRKAQPSYTLPTDLQATYGQTLADVSLPSGFAWQDATTGGVGSVGTNSFTAIFTPEDTALYDTEVVTLVVTVGRAPLTVKAEDKTVEQYGELPALTYTVSGWIGEDTFVVDPTATVGITDTKTYGTYAITVSGGINDNYDITYVAGTLTVTAHTVHTEGAAPTCAAPAVCAVCLQAYGEALGHEMAKTESTAATCTEAGNHAYYTCTVCEKVYADEQGSTQTTVAEQVIPAAGHTENDEWSSDETGHFFVCVTCGEALTPAAHIPGPAATEQAAQTCTACGYVLAEALPHTHVFGEAWLSDGENHWQACACGETDATAAHVWDEGKVKKEPTSTEEGIKEYACTVCGATKTEPVDKLAETPSPNGTAGCAGSLGSAALLPLLFAIPAALWPMRKKED